MITLQIDDTKTQLTYADGSGNKHNKSIDLNEFASLLSANVSHDFGLLPAGCRYLAQKGANTFVAVEVPGGTHEISYNNGSSSSVAKIKNVNLPPGLFLFMLNKAADGRYNLLKSKLYALKNDSVMIYMDTMFHYPAPNIYDDGRICWGSNETATKGIKSLAALSGLARIFYSAPFNNDLFRASIHLGPDFPWREANATGENLVKGYFQYLSEHSFDRLWLRPMDETQNNLTKVIKLFQEGL